MSPLQYIRLAIGIVVITIVVILGGLAKHYHDSWVQVTADLASKQVQLEQALDAAKQCSDNTKRLADEAKDKESKVAEAQKQAALSAKKNKALASQILSLQTSNPNHCEAALDLINQHKSQTKGQ